MTDQVLPDAAAQLQTHRAEYMAGTLSQAQFMAHSERLAPLAAEGASAPADTPSVAETKELEALRVQRSEGKLTDEQHQEAMAKLGPVADPAAADVVYTNPDGSTTTLPAAEAAALDDSFAPPASPAHYDIPTDGTPESIAWHTSACESLHKAGIPNEIARYAHEAMTGLGSRLATADQAQIESHMANFRSQLEQQWGEQFQARMDRTIDFIADIDGPFGELLAEKTWLIADPLLFLKLETLAEHRGRVRVNKGN